ncbi:hypothetical protein EVAR_3561_1 [Eumeta japonica]|uniref:Uncharacterized protein n=1 Tax=Eumeta variegata TaxID=151549 RepID=A0A4C1SY60_EUMVA|nr:hypothetical protein EVAR_3561_1 [Eumeta japonica]
MRWGRVSDENFASEYIITRIVVFDLISCRRQSTEYTDGRAIGSHHSWIRVAGCITNAHAHSRKRPAPLKRNNRSRHTFSPCGRKRGDITSSLRRAGGLHPSLRISDQVTCPECCARGRPIIVEWERDARHSAGLSLVRIPVVLNDGYSRLKSSRHFYPTLCFSGCVRFSENSIGRVYVVGETRGAHAHRYSYLPSTRSLCHSGTCFKPWVQNVIIAMGTTGVGSARLAPGQRGGLSSKAFAKPSSQQQKMARDYNICTAVLEAEGLVLRHRPAVCYSTLVIGEINLETGGFAATRAPA